MNLIQEARRILDAAGPDRRLMPENLMRQTIMLERQRLTRMRVFNKALRDNKLDQLNREEFPDFEIQGWKQVGGFSRDDVLLVLVNLYRLRRQLRQERRANGIPVSLNPRSEQQFQTEVGLTLPAVPGDPDAWVRLFIDPQNNLYAFNGSLAAHRQIAPALGLDYRESARGRCRFTWESGEPEIVIRDDLFPFADRGTIQSGLVHQITQEFFSLFPKWKVVSRNLMFS